MRSEQNQGNNKIQAVSDQAGDAVPLPVTGAILLVDDDPHVLKALKRVLHGQPYRVISAGSATEALSVAARVPIAVAVLDYWMPILDGLWLSRELRERHPEVVRLMLTGCAELPVVKEAVTRGEIYRFLVKPWDEGELLKTIAQALSLAAASAGNSPEPVPAPDECSAALAQLISAVAPDAEPGAEPDARRIRELFELTRAVEGRDPGTMGHSSRVAELAMRLGEALGLSPAQLDELKLGALMHDVGKVAVPDSILFKPAKLSAHEMSSIQAHAVHGYKMLRDIGVSDAVADIAHHHHENYDGTGYPARLDHDQIPLAARIVRLADSFDAMSHPRPYRRSVPTPAILEEFAAQSGTIYDPDLTRVFISLAGGG